MVTSVLNSMPVRSQSALWLYGANVGATRLQLDARVGGLCAIAIRMSMSPRACAIDALIWLGWSSTPTCGTACAQFGGKFAIWISLATADAFVLCGLMRPPSSVPCFAGVWSAPRFLYSLRAHASHVDKRRRTAVRFIARRAVRICAAAAAYSASCACLHRSSASDWIARRFRPPTSRPPHAI